MDSSQSSNFVPRNMVIFDFSGTLSLEATVFAQVESLVPALKQSGLWQLGVNNPKMLWREVISPTWNISSTTARSYKEIMTEKIIEVLGIKEDELQKTINNSVNQFIDSYFASARIATEWKPLLECLLNQSDTLAVIATDHYLEATGHIHNQLELLGIGAVSALNVDKLESDSRQVIIANSAELGARKAKRGFWDRLQESLPVKKLSLIIMIDDFGANEPLARSDNLETRVQARMRNTSAHISAVFQAQVKIVPFYVKGRPLDDENFQVLVEQTGEFITQRVAGEQSL